MEQKLIVESKLSEKEMIRLVEEVSRLDLERQQMLDKTEVARILNDLNLPSELLDEALARLEEKKAAKQRQKTLTKQVSIAAVVIVLIVGIFMTSSINSQNQLAKIDASDARICLDANSSESLLSVNSGSTVFVNTTLHDVPVGNQLALHARWYGPDNSIYHENSWQTHQTTSRTWNTHAKCVIAQDAPKGEWRVEVSIDGRPVISKKFQVK